MAGVELPPGPSPNLLSALGVLRVPAIETSPPELPPHHEFWVVPSHTPPTMAQVSDETQEASVEALLLPAVVEMNCCIPVLPLIRTRICPSPLFHPPKMPSLELVLVDGR